MFTLLQQYGLLYEHAVAGVIIVGKSLMFNFKNIFTYCTLKKYKQINTNIFEIIKCIKRKITRKKMQYTF